MYIWVTDRMEQNFPPRLQTRSQSPCRHHRIFLRGRGGNPKHQFHFKAPLSQRIPVAATRVCKIFPPPRLATFKRDPKFIHCQFACICPCLKVMIFIPVWSLPHTQKMKPCPLSA